MKKIKNATTSPKGSLLQNFTSYILERPKRLFLIDGIGAGWTGSVLLFFVGQKPDLFGLPKQEVHLLAAIAFLYSVYSIGCYFLVKSRWRPFIKIIAFANQLYCVATLLLLFSNFSSITALGWGYFSIEIMVIFILSQLELKISNSLQ